MVVCIARGCLKSTGARCNHVHRGRRAVLVELKSKQTQRTRVAGPRPSTRIREVDVSIKYCNIIIYKGALSRETLHCNTTRPRSTCSVPLYKRKRAHVYIYLRAYAVSFWFSHSYYYFSFVFVRRGITNCSIIIFRRKLKALFSFCFYIIL